MAGTTQFVEVNGNLMKMKFLRTNWFLVVALVLLGAILPGFAEDTVTASPNRKNVVVLGDSLAAGYGLDPAESYPSLLQTNIDRAGLNFMVVNAGLSGDTTAGGLRRIEWILKRPVDVLVLELGGNDGLRGIAPTETRTNLQGIIDRTRQKYPDVQIIIAGMMIPPSMGAEYFEAFKNIFPELAKSNHTALIPFLLEGVGGHPELNQPDQIHPTAEGAKIVAENVWKVLLPVLEKVNSGNRKK